MTRFDFSPLFRSTVGFDRMTPFLESALRMEEASENYPPYNIVKSGEDNYRISLAVAGFGEDDLDIELERGTLTVTGRKTPEAEDEEKGTTYLHRGIARRGFKRQFQLADYVEVLGAHLEHGLLHIDLERRLPENMKPREIRISVAQEARKGKVIDGKAA